MKKKFLSVVLALAMVLSLMPAAFAVEGGVSTAEELKTAIENAPKDGSQVTITLDADISDMSTDQIVTIAEGQNILLDMAEHSIKVASAFAGRPIRNEGTLTVTGNGTIDSSNSNTGGYGAIDNYGTLTIENGTFTGSVNASGASIKNRPDGDLTIKDGTFNGAVTAVYNAGIAKIYNGLFDCRSCSACNSSSWGYTIQSHMDEEGKSPQLYFYNGTVIGVQGGFSTSAGYSEIHDGSFKTVSCATHTNGSSAHYALYIAGEDEDVKCVVYGGSFESVSKTAALIGNDNTGGDGGINANATTEIKGGTFKAPAGQKAVTGAENTGNPVITGGKFSSDVSEYLSEGYIWDQNTGVVEKLGAENAVAQVGEQYFATLPAAVAAVQDGGTVTMLRDASGAGVGTFKGATDGTGVKNFTIDFAGHTYTCTGPAVGSAGTQSQAFHLEWNGNDQPNAQVILKNGTITSTKDSGVRMIVQNYCDLTLENMIVDGSNLQAKDYTVSNNCGNVTIQDTTIIEPKAGGFAFDSCDYASYTGVCVTVKGNSYIQGAMECTNPNGGAENAQIIIESGLFSSDPSAYCVDGKTGVTNTDNATKADYPYAVGEEVADAKPAVVESATVPANTPENASDDVKNVAQEMTGGAGVKQDAALEGAIKDAANGNKIEGNTELATGKTVTATLNEATNGSANDNDVAIVYQPYVDVTVTDAVKSGATVTSFTADLTPMYRVVATTNAVVSGGMEIKVSGEVDADANAVLIESGKELNGLADRQYEVKLALPNDFANAGDKLCIKHDKNGSAEYYTGTVSEDGGKLFVTFISNGFSPFTVYAASETAASIGDNVYPTLQAAVDAVENNGTIKLLKDGETATVSRTVKFTVDPSGKNYTISLGGNCTDKDAGEHIFDVVYTAPSSGGGSSSATYTVNVEKSKHGSVESNRSRASSGTTVTLTVQPDKGYELDELTVTDKDGDELKLTQKSDTKYTFTMPRSAVTVEAVFVEEREDTGYSDVSADAWYADAVQYVTDKGMMQGNNGKFMPADKLNRGQMAQVLFNLEGKQPVNYAMSFGDVNGSEWFAEAVRWAASEKIVSGYDNGNFGPNDPITREQLAVILFRYAQYKGMDTVTLEENLTGFADADEISGYAVSALNWAVGAGVLKGTGTGLAPKANATRSEVAQMLMNFDQNVMK